MQPDDEKKIMLTRFAHSTLETGRTQRGFTTKTQRREVQRFRNCRSQKTDEMTGLCDPEPRTPEVPCRRKGVKHCPR